MTNTSKKTKDEITGAILSYLREAAPAETSNITVEAPILELIDSFAIVEMLENLEDLLQININLELAEPSDLATADSLAQFLVANQ